MKLNRVCVVYIALLFLATGCANQKSSNDPMINPETIIAMWLFDEDHEQLATDSSGNGHDGNLMEHPMRVPGKLGTALQFGGDGDAVVVPDFGKSVPSSEVTVVAWVKLEEVKNQDLFSLVPINRSGHWRPDIDDRFTVHFPWNKPIPNAIHWQFVENRLGWNVPWILWAGGNTGALYAARAKFHENLQKWVRSSVEAECVSLFSPYCGFAHRRSA